MSTSIDEPNNKPKPSSSNLTLAAILGQVGCLTIVIIFVALFGGLWLDKYLDTKPLFTVGLMILSVPVTLLVMFWIVRTGIKKFKKDGNRSKKTTMEES